jgi:outer membrane protein OmpA-like peptidoglycan-associated protein
MNPKTNSHPFHPASRWLNGGPRPRFAACTLAAALLALAALPGAALAQAAAPALSPVPARITDQAIHADYATYERQQAAIKALNDSGRHRVASYSLAKAQCWLDVSFHEYSRNDRSPFPQAALTESHRITQYLAQGGDAAGAANPARQTPLVNNAARVRPDLWDRATQLKDHAGYRCAEQRVACAEVELVHAGNEQNQQGWRHAKPYVQIAEDQLAEAAQAAQACVPPPAPPAPPAPPPAPPAAPTVAAPPAPAPVVVAPPPVPLRVVQRQANVLFNFDKRDMANVRSLTKDTLDKLVAEIKSGAFTLQRITLAGHADISKNSTDQRYNDQLAIDRAQTIKNYLVAQGISAALISTVAKSDSEQVASCDSRRMSRPAYQECLLPNRRVEVLAEGVAPARA